MVPAAESVLLIDYNSGKLGVFISKSPQGVYLIGVKVKIVYVEDAGFACALLFVRRIFGVKRLV